MFLLYVKEHVHTHMCITVSVSLVGVILLFGALHQEDERGSWEHTHHKTKMREVRKGGLLPVYCH